MIFDTHCHLQFKSFDSDRPSVIRRCDKKKLIMNIVGTQAETSKRAVELAEKYDNMYATVGLHPIQHDEVVVEEEGDKFKSKNEEFDFDYYSQLIERSKKVIAVGETGMDAYHVPKDKDLKEVLGEQWKLFLRHLELAQKYSLPLVIHVRDCHNEMIKRLSAQGGSALGGQDQNVNTKGVFHCFSGTWGQAQEYLNMGFYLGFTGVITFPPKKTDPQSQLDLLEVIEKIPLEKLLIETDAPYLAPQKYRGERCEPWMVHDVAEKIAEIREMSVEEIENITNENANKLFYKIK
ncbi:TatD family hydrolase [Patescibacteria group bacterium]|nr:TatD family hydrolase [Patescibacteria group bacterium]MBU1895995.1 TatD family hydrolase [Patescibacteria group bacterium]